MFKEIRPEDVTLNVALSDEPSTLTYRRFEDPAHNGFFPEDHVKNRPDYLGCVEVKALGVKEFLSTYVGDNAIDFMNIDVEGFESKILGKWDWQKHRPKLICAELFGSDIESVMEHPVYHLLKAQGYRFLSRIWQGSMFGDAKSFYRAI